MQSSQCDCATEEKTSSAKSSSPQHKTENTTIRVVSYNVLSSSLSSSQWFTECRPENCDPDQRFVKLLKKLDAEMNLLAIICLQEIPMEWAGKLFVFFANHGYRFFHSFYGNQFDGYMGVGIAFPMYSYRLTDAHIKTIADLWPPIPEPNTFEKARQQFNDILETITAWVSDKLSQFFESPTDLNWQVKKRKNRMLAIKLSYKGCEFWVATYHMPCAFRTPEVMNVHAALVTQELQTIADMDPCILAGDFNFKPREQGYFLIREGGIGNYSLPPVLTKSERKWSPRLRFPMKSAYKEFCGAEPDFTNWAVVKNNPPFIECLDYIFYSNKLKVVDVLKLPDRNNIQGPLPNATEPSDHLMIGAVFQFQ